MRAIVVVVLLARASLALGQEPGAPVVPDQAGGDDAVHEVAPEVAPEVAREVALRVESAALARRAGRLEDALADLERAHALDPSPERLWAVAQILDALRRDEALAEAYRRYLEQAPEGAHAAEARARLAVIESLTPRAVPEEERSAPAPSTPVRQWWEEPWLWAVIGIVAVGAIAVAIFASGSTSGTQAPLPGDDGVVVRTLVELP